MTRALLPCGTDAAYQRHRSAGERPCEECRAAHAAVMAESNRNRARALTRLSRRHWAEYTALLAEERSR